jgi:hypothetical protein
MASTRLLNESIQARASALVLLVGISDRATCGDGRAYRE